MYLFKCYHTKALWGHVALYLELCVKVRLGPTRDEQLLETMKPARAMPSVTLRQDSARIAT